MLKFNSSRGAVKSARFIAENEYGEVIGDADTYEEALTLGGSVVIDTQKSPLESKFEMEKFSKNIVKEIMSGRMEENAAAELVAEKRGCNVGYAKKLLSSWIESYKPELLASGVKDLSEELNKRFDVDGNLFSWFEDYVGENGIASSKGGELVRAASKVISAWQAGGDKIGRGMGKLSVNSAARFILSKTDLPINSEIEGMLSGESVVGDEEYSEWIEDFSDEIEAFLRDNEELFHEANDEDFADWGEDEDYSEEPKFGVVYFKDGRGIQYWFEEGDDGWKCSDVVYNQSLEYSEGDRFGEDDPAYANINPEIEWGEFEKDGIIYSWEAVGDADEDGKFHEWEIVQVAANGQVCAVGDSADPMDFGAALYDEKGNELGETELVSQAFIRSIHILNKGKYGIQVNKGFKANNQAETRDDWILIDKNGNPDDTNPVEFNTREDAEISELFRNAKLRYADVRVVSYKDVNR